ncbi:hypothetical protein LA080_010213 [Diaporthe eres]|nr:hypothetical protein LA080_010213 [Diaporthe eres]
MSSIKFAALTALAGIAFGAPSNITTRSIDLKPVYTNGTISVEHLSVAGNLDGFKMSTPAARGSADFWYFDVCSSASNQTLNIVFFNSGEFSQYPQPLAGVGSFKGSALDEPNVEYIINLDSPQMDIYGTIVFKSIAPAHYPYELNRAVGADQNLLPGLYWANAVPDANTAVDLQVGDTTVSFVDGVGYHDKNWGNKSIIDGSLLGRLDGEVLLVSCDSDALVLLQKGEEAAWPPTTGLLETEGISVNYTLPDGRVFAVDVKTELIVRDESGAYQRANGLLRGGFVGEETGTIEGRAHYEEFIFGIVNDYTPAV